MKPGYPADLGVKLSQSFYSFILFITQCLKKNHMADDSCTREMLVVMECVLPPRQYSVARCSRLVDKVCIFRCRKWWEVRWLIVAVLYSGGLIGKKGWPGVRVYAPGRGTLLSWCALPSLPPKATVSIRRLILCCRSHGMVESFNEFGNPVALAEERS